MKRVSNYLFIFTVLSFLFLFIAPLFKSANAATCASLTPIGYYGICATSQICKNAIEGTSKGSTSDCGSNICCVAKSSCLENAAGQYCSLQTCPSGYSSSNGTCATGYCCKKNCTSVNGYVCKQAQTGCTSPLAAAGSGYSCGSTSLVCCKPTTVTSTKCADMAPTGYSSSCTSSNLCSAEGNGTISGSTDCLTGSVCCKFLSSTTNTCTTAGGGRNCQPTSTGCTGGFVRDSAYYCGSTSLDCCKPNTQTVGNCYYSGCDSSSASYNLSSQDCNDQSCDTSVGNISTRADNVRGTIKAIFTVLLSIVGGLGILQIIISGYKILASQGNPEKVQEGRSQLTAAVVGLIFIVFSLVALLVIGIDIIGIPGIN